MNAINRFKYVYVYNETTRRFEKRRNPNYEGKK